MTESRTDARRDTSVLQVDAISLAFGGVTVFEGISLDVRDGELLALIGPNGAGKTSVLNCISGIYQPRRGQVRLQGREITGLRPNRIATLGVARTFQHAELVPEMSVLENLLIGRHSLFRVPLWHQCLHSYRARAAEARTGPRRGDHRVRRARGPSRQARWWIGVRPAKVVGFARALAMRPSVILLDEPSAGLNREEKENLARFILRIRHELRIPMLWVEHDMQMVADLADRICALNYGHFRRRHARRGAERPARGRGLPWPAPLRRKGDRPPMAIDTIRVYTDYKSPYAYLAKDLAYALERDTGVMLDWLPYTLDIPAYLGSAKVDASGDVLE
ncbi:MAG: ATP-binding cassette domain-containing protein [Burkholderiaceae bacterium]